MSYTVLTSAKVEVFSSDNNNKLYFKLPETTLSGSSNLVYPHQISSRIEQGTTEVINLVALGYSKLVLLVVKANRPIKLLLQADEDAYSFPQGTFFHTIFKIDDQPSNIIQNITIEVPVIPGSAPAIRPESLPNAIVEIFLACEDKPFTLP
jgi:hypothetical protein